MRWVWWLVLLVLLLVVGVAGAARLGDGTLRVETEVDGG